MAVTTGGRRQDKYLVLVGIAVGILLTGVLAPLVGSDSTTSPTAQLDASGSPSAGAAATASPDGSAGTGAPTADGSSPATAGGRGAVVGAKQSAGAAAGRAGASTQLSLTASDRGVTAESIKVGTPIIDIGSLGKLGIQVPGLSPEEQREAWGVFWDDLNRRGGIGGRKVTYVFHEFDITDSDQLRATCLALTQDQKVFAVVDAGGFYGPAVLCITRENATPMLANGTVGTPKGYYTKSNGMLMTVLQSGVRLMRNFAWELGRMGRLKGHKVGLLYGGTTDDDETIDAFTVALRDQGAEIAHREELSPDMGTAASQIPVAVQRMRTANVDSVMLTSSLVTATQFVQNASSQGYNPRYYTTDYNAGSNDTYTAGMPDSFAGSLSISTTRLYEVRVGKPEAATDAACRQLWEKATGKTVARGSVGYASTVEICNMVRLFEAGATAAGPNLTRTGFSQGIQGLGHVLLADFGDGNFRPGKLDAVDMTGTLQWYSDCKCWKPIEFQHPVHDTSNSD